MGRHSAPDDDGNDHVDAAVLTDDVAAAQDADGAGDAGDEDALDTGRHSRPAPNRVGGLPAPVITAPKPGPGSAQPALVQPVQPAPEDEPLEHTQADEPAKPRRSSTTDFALVKQHSDVRARCIAAVVVPFVLYLAVMFAIGATGRQLLLWIFIPLIIAGILVGVFLDAGHRRHATPAGPDPAVSE